MQVNMTSENAQEITTGKSYDLTYSVHWVRTDRTFDRRFDRYLDSNFFEHQIHWFSLFNSFMMVSGGPRGGGGADEAAVVVEVAESFNSWARRRRACHSANPPAARPAPRIGVRARCRSSSCAASWR